jgi:glycosyltransferase involved in cell wall biosynthesis
MIPSRFRVGILSTFPPTPCGLATFSAALAAGLIGHGAEVRVVRIADGTGCSSPLVVGDLENGRPASIAAAVDLLNECHVVVVQHEYGLYGGADGDEVIDILGGLRVPSVVIAHTVLSAPTAHQRSVLVEVAALADRIVVMSAAAGRRMTETFGVDPDDIATIPHGATLALGPPGATAARPTLLTWGLVGPGKGLERVIEAMPRVQRQVPTAQYLVAGRTHPKVLATEGESYREARIEQATRHDIADSVHFDANYRDVPTLTALIQAASAVVLPYDSREQATSGVLVDAIAAGRPVVATAFPHAVEMLASGAGIIVEHDDPDAMARALTRVLGDTGAAAGMAAEARRIAPSLGWPVVASAFLELADRVLLERKAFV